MTGLQLFLGLLCLCSAQAGKLLVIPADGSHWIGMKPLVEELGRRGHQVVVVIPEAGLRVGPSEHTNTITYPVPFSNAHVEKAFETTLTTLMNQAIVTELDKIWNFLYTLHLASPITVRNCESLFFHKELVQKLKDWDFDAVLTDPIEPTGAIMGEYLSIPSIYMQVNLPCGGDSLASQCPNPASYVPHDYTFYTDRMSFWQRSVNMLRTLLQPLACRHLYAPGDKVASKFLQRETSMMEIMSRGALWLMRFDFVFEFPRPVMPNMVMIGGLNPTKPKPLSLVSIKNAVLIKSSYMLMEASHKCESP